MSAKCSTSTFSLTHSELTLSSGTERSLVVHPDLLLSELYATIRPVWKLQSRCDLKVQKTDVNSWSSKSTKSTLLRPFIFRRREPWQLYLGPVYTDCQHQCCDDASSTVLIENNGVTWKWAATLLWSGSIVFNEKSMASIIAEIFMELHISRHLRFYLNEW